MALRAVTLIGVVFFGECIAVARDTLRAVVLDFLRRRGRGVRVVAGDAPHCIASFLLAHTLRQSLHLAERTHSAAVVTGIDKVSNKIGEILTGLEFIEMAPGLLDRDVSFEMALHADLVTPLGREFRGIDDRAGIGGVELSGAVATLARNPAMRKNGRRIFILRAGERRLQSAGVANPTGSAPAPQAGAPSATPGISSDTLYQNALRDYNSGRYDLSRQEFSDFLKNFPDSDLAGNSQFYLGEIDFSQANYQDALAAYDMVLVNYPKSYKLAAASLKKGEAMLALGQKASAIRQFRSVVSRFPGTDESKRAESHLRQLAPSPAAH